MAILQNAVYRLVPVLWKYQWHFSQMTEKNFFTTCMEIEKTLKKHAVLREKEAMEDSDSLTSVYCRAIVISAAWNRNSNRNMGQWNTIENPEINSCPNGPLIYDKGGSNVQWRKDKLFYKWCWKILTANGKRMKLGHSLLVVQWPSRVWHFVKLWMAALQVSLSSTVSWSLPGSYPLPQWWHPTFSSLSLASHSAFRLSQHQGLFQWVGSSHQVAKVLELQLQQQSFQWLFRVDFLQDWLVCSPCCPRNSQGSSPAPQFRKHQFFGVLPPLWSISHNHM